MGAEIRDTVIQVLAGHFGLPKHRLLTGAQFSDMGVNSLDQCEIVMTVEEHFDLSIPPEDARALSSLGELIDYIARHKAAA